MRRTGERYGAGAALAWAAQPGTLVGLAVLVVNDHLLKRAWPGLVTGKLSDVAGMLVAPPLLALLFSWLRGRSSDRQAVVALLLTGVGFALAKSSGQGAELASRAWSLTGVPSRMVGDPTDLLALPALGPAWLCWRRARTRPVAAAGARRVRALVVVPLLVAGTVATSEIPVVDHGWLASSGGRVYLVASEFDVGPLDGPLMPKAVTDDGGRTWQVLRHAGPLSSAVVARPEACVPDQPEHCFQLDAPHRPLVEETTDGGRNWTIAWQLSPGRAYYRSRNTDQPDTYDPRALVVQRVPGGFAVIVDNGADGLLLRDAAGRWSRPDLPVAAPPAPLAGFGGVVAVEFVLAMIWAGLCGVVLRRTIEWRTDGHGSFPLLFAYGLGGLPALVWFENRIYRETYDTLVIPALLFVGAVALLVTAVATRPRRSRAGARGAVTVPLVVPAFFALTLAPYAGWTEGSPDSFVTASWLTVGAAVLSYAASILLGLRLARRTPRHWGRPRPANSPPWMNQPPPFQRPAPPRAAPPGSDGTAEGSDRGTE